MYMIKYQIIKISSNVYVFIISKIQICRWRGEKMFLRKKVFGNFILSQYYIVFLQGRHILFLRDNVALPPDFYANVISFLNCLCSVMYKRDIDINYTSLFTTKICEICLVIFQYFYLTITFSDFCEKLETRLVHVSF